MSKNLNEPLEPATEIAAGRTATLPRPAEEPVTAPAEALAAEGIP